MNYPVGSRWVYRSPFQGSENNTTMTVTEPPAGYTTVLPSDGSVVWGVFDIPDFRNPFAEFEGKHRFPKAHLFPDPT